MSLILTGLVVTLLCMALTRDGDGEDHPEKHAKVAIVHHRRPEEPKPWETIGGP